jgi:hypothetical protein
MPGGLSADISSEPQSEWYQEASKLGVNENANIEC